jgi:hypothetical protein
MTDRHSSRHLASRPRRENPADFLLNGDVRNPDGVTYLNGSHGTVRPQAQRVAMLGLRADFGEPDWGGYRFIRKSGHRSGSTPWRAARGRRPR